MLIMIGCSGAEYTGGLSPYESCGLSSDQMDTFDPKLTTTSINLLVDPAFSVEETGAIAQGVQPWTSELMLSGLINSADVYISSDVTPLKTEQYLVGCDQVVFNSNSIAVVRISSATDWQRIGPSSGSIAAVTLRCYDSSRNLTKQTIIFGPQVSGALAVRSTMIHEFGHAVGLKHSCSTNGVNGPDCARLNYDHPYIRAVMYPFLIPGDPSKLALNSNDTLRARCLYPVSGQVHWGSL